MKTIVTLALTLIALTTQARSLHPDTFAKSARLTEFHIDQNGPLNELGINFGSVKVNPVTKQLKLTLEYPVKCQRGFLCIQVLRQRVVDLKIKEIKNDCGSVVYVAKRDMTPADGAHEVITVQDNTRRLCEDLRPAATEITYTSSFYSWPQRRFMTYRHFFLANPLKSIFK